ncbi:MAG: glycine oxidase ThiO [Acidimicrobiales bacterium]
MVSARIEDDPNGPSYDVAIAGAGAIGLSAAWLLARSGRRVVLVDPTPGHGAVWVAAGMLAPAGEAHFGEERLTRLLVAGASRWPTFALELEHDASRSIGFQRSGTLAVAADPSDRAALDRLCEFRSSLGLVTKRLTGSACRHLVPSLSPHICGGAELPGDHQVDNRRLVDALLSACAAVGVTLLHGRVEAFRHDHSGALGLITDRGLVRAPVVLVAMGWQSSALAGVPDGILPAVRPVKGHVLRLKADTPLVPRTVRGLVNGRACYIVPREDNSLVVGATVEERGDDLRVQAAAVHALLDDARTLLPGVDELELAECSVGLRPGSADNGPHVGWTEISGLAVATGHFRNGVLLAPITAQAIVALLDGQDPAAELTSFGVRARPGTNHQLAAPR